MTTDKRYNGWTNYETWAVKLWMDNEEGTSTYWRERTRAVFVSAEPSFSFQSPKDTARIDLADELKREHEENAPDLGASVFSDLLGAALSEVDWREIAAVLLDDMAEAATYDQDEAVLAAWNTPSADAADASAK